MDYRKTDLHFLRADCANEFGREKGMNIYTQTCALYSSMLADADYRNNKSIKKHIVKTMFPAIAYYLTLQAHGYSKEEAYRLTLQETQKAARILKKKNERLVKLPIGFKTFKFFCKRVMKKAYPVEGWETEWVRFDNKEIHIDLKRCLYVDLTTQHGCPELCTVFCKNDVTSFSGYEPKIHFRRNSTLAEGDACCDFHFSRGE